MERIGGVRRKLEELERIGGLWRKLEELERIGENWRKLASIASRATWLKQRQRAFSVLVSAFCVAKPTSRCRKFRLQLVLLISCSSPKDFVPI